MENLNLTDVVYLATLAKVAEFKIDSVIKSDKAFEEQTNEIKEVVNDLKNELEEFGFYIDDKAFEDGNIGFESKKLIDSILSKAKAAFFKLFKDDDEDYEKELEDVSPLSKLDFEKYTKRFASLTNKMGDDFIENLEYILKIRKEIINAGLNDFGNIEKIADSYATLFFGGKISEFDATGVSKILERELNFDPKDYVDYDDAKLVAMVVKYDGLKNTIARFNYLANLNEKGEARAKVALVSIPKKVPSEVKTPNEDELKRTLEKAVKEIADTKIYKEKLDKNKIWKIILNAITKIVTVTVGSVVATQASITVPTVLSLAGGMALNAAVAYTITLKVIRNVDTTISLISGVKKMVVELDKDILEIDKTLKGE